MGEDMSLNPESLGLKMNAKRIFRPRHLVDGPWIQLLDQAYRLIDSLCQHSGLSILSGRWGGGTVLMLRYRHRKSKDIDGFVPEPQYLGYLNPRLSDLAADISQD